MDMSRAALPPRHGPVYPEDTKHPRYQEYRRYRSAMIALLVEAAGFREWLHCQEQNEVNDALQEHPRFREFQTWMRTTQAGARKCPAGNYFPKNFYHWLEGGRW